MDWINMKVWERTQWHRDYYLWPGGRLLTLDEVKNFIKDVETHKEDYDTEYPIEDMIDSMKRFPHRICWTDKRCKICWWELIDFFFRSPEDTWQWECWVEWDILMCPHCKKDCWFWWEYMIS